MQIALRDYQADQIERGRAALRRHRRVLLQAPTGAGKTALASYMAEQSAKAGGLVDFICHRRELVQQTSFTFTKFGIAHGFVSSGWPTVGKHLVQVCSIDTLKGRIATQPEPRLAIWDECHHMGAAGWAAVMAAWPRAYHIGLSATPSRLDGKALSAYFDELVLGPSPSWLIDNGHLSDYRIYAPPAPPELRARGMNDGTSDQAKLLDKPKLTGDVIAHWLKLANGLRTVGFACNVAHSLRMVDAFNAAGIPAAHLDGNTKRAERARIIREFALGRLRVLWNVSLFGEGFDLAAIAQADVTIDCVILNRQTQSLGLYLQMVGRALRPSPGKVAIILDHAGNFLRHGYPDDEREWSLEGRAAGNSRAANDEGPPPPMQCKGCYLGITRKAIEAMRRENRPFACPHCDKAFELPSRSIVVEDGELEEVTQEDRRRVRFEREQEERIACDGGISALMALAHRRGYSYPQQWALKRLAAHAAKQRQAA